MRLRPARLLACGALALFATLGLTARPAIAQVPTSEAPPSAGADARQHFERALGQYRSGQYTGALDSLRQAARLDPDGKDLFFNLALVHEKLGQLPEAIAALERFRELEPDEVERERARLAIQRLRGAEAELRRPAAPAPCPEPPRAPAARPGPDPLLVGTASLAVVSLVVGAVFGVKALADDVSDVSTSPSTSLTQLRERGRRAQRHALVADVSFALAAASAGAFASVWLLTPTEPATRAAGITMRSYF